MKGQVSFTLITPTAIIAGIVCAIAGDYWSATIWAAFIALDFRIKRVKP